MNNLRDKKAFISDMDGVIYHGNNLLPGALEFIREIRQATRFAIVSDTFVEFAQPLMDKLENPFLLCHSLETDSTGRIVNYHLRQSDPKRKTVQAFKSLMYNVVAFGDSYNDVTMIAEADKGILFCPPDNVKADFPQYPVVNDLDSLKRQLLAIVK